MNSNIIFTAIRAGLVVGVALFALVDSALAAPTLSPVMVSDITSTSAILTGYVMNPHKNSIVWFEWSEAYSNSAPNTVALQGIYNESPFKYALKGLTPGTTYSYRSAAMESGVTVYSSTASFKTPSLTGNVAMVTSYQAQSGPLGVGPITNPVAPQAAVVTQQAAVGKSATTVAKAPQAVAPIESKEGFTNTNAAAVIGAGGGLLPTTLIGWLLLLISVLIAVLIADMIYKSIEKRKKEREEKERAEAEAETE